MPKVREHIVFWLVFIVISIVACVFSDKAESAGVGYHVYDYSEPAYESHWFSAMSAETNTEEATWQALNVVDTLQTVQIARNPTCYEEVGTLRMFTGPHPSVKGAVLGGIGFSIAHYVAARAIENLVDYNPDYRVVQRVFQFGGLLWKGQVVYHNDKIGLKVGHSRQCSS